MEALMKHASFLDAVKTVLSGFIGIRRKSSGTPDSPLRVDTRVPA